MTDYTLHCFAQSGNAYKAALMLQLAGADWKPQFVDFLNGANRSPEFRAINEMGEVPVLVDHTIKDENGNDLALSQSGLILWHLADHFPQFAATNPTEHREVLRWILFDNHKMTGSLSVFRFLRTFMKKGESPEAQFMKTLMMSALKTLNRRLNGRDWVAAPHCTIADISLAGYLFWPDQSEIELTDYQHIANWLDRISALPNYARPEDIMPASAEV